jgi:hypothetical protein
MKKTQKGQIKKAPKEKGAPAKCKSFPVKIKNTEASFANPTVGGEGDAFWFKSQATSHTRMAN